MTSFERIRLVAMREIRERGKSKAYIISTIFTLVILGGAIVVPGLLGGGPSTHEVGLVGDGGDEIVTTAAELAEQEADEDEEPDTFETSRFDTIEEAEAALDGDEVDVVLVDTSEIVIAGFGGFGGPGGGGVTGLLQQAASTLRVQELVSENESAAEVISILSSEPLTTRDVGGSDEENAGLRGVIAFGGLVLMYFAVLTYGTWMLSGVTEEKTNRVVEILLSTLKPWEIFAGKLTGIGMLGLGQMVMLVTVGLIGIQIQGSVEVPDLPIDSVVALIGWFILGFLLYATLFGAAGSLVSRMEDAQNAAAPLSILAVVGYIFSFVALNDPTTLWAQVGTYFPFTAPYVAPIRLALQEIAWWEMTIAVAVTIATLVVLIGLAGRVYAGGLLRFGSRVKWMEAFRSAE